MKKAVEYFIVATGIAVLAGILVILYAVAYMRSGHPPASGIVFLIVVFILSPFSLAAVIAGVFTVKLPTRLNSKLVYSMLGINLLFSYLLALIFFFKVILGATI